MGQWVNSIKQSATTGAGGANVWSHRLLKELMVPDQLSKTKSPYKSLLLDADIRVAIRRTTRVDENEGDIIEDLGITPDFVHEMTRNDVLNNNEDLNSATIDLIANSKLYTIQIVIQERDDKLPIVELTTKNVDRIDATVETVQLRSLTPRRGKCSIDLQQELGDSNLKSIEIEIRGYSVNRLVVCHRKKITISYG